MNIAHFIFRLLHIRNLLTLFVLTPFCSPCTPFVDYAHLFAGCENTFGDYTDFSTNCAHISTNCENTYGEYTNFSTNYAHLSIDYENTFGDYTDFSTDYAHNSDDCVNTLDDWMNIAIDLADMFDISYLYFCIPNPTLL
jgi:hypothetical protein